MVWCGGGGGCGVSGTLFFTFFNSFVRFSNSMFHRHDDIFNSNCNEASLHLQMKTAVVKICGLRKRDRKAEKRKSGGKLFEYQQCDRMYNV